MKLFLIICTLALAACTKEYVQRPTCYRYLEIVKRWDGEMRPLTPDTLYPSSRQASIVCDDDTTRLLNFQGKFEGCSGGWQQVTYKLVR